MKFHTIPLNPVDSVDSVIFGFFYAYDILSGVIQPA